MKPSASLEDEITSETDLASHQARDQADEGRMKNATKHAGALKALAKKLAKAHDAGERPTAEPLHALVLGVLREAAPESPATRAMEIIADEFVDLNELRVATELELEDMLEPLYDDDAERAAALTGALSAIFDVEGRLSLDRVANLSKREQRPALHKIAEASEGEITPYVEAHVSLVAFGIGVVPIDEPMRGYLVEEGVIDAEADVAEAQKFIEQNLKLDECWPFFVGCRAELYGAQKPGKTPRKVSKSAK